MSSPTAPTAPVGYGFLVEPSGLRLAGEALASDGDGLLQAAGRLRQITSQVGAAWGDDVPGATFAEGYLYPAKEAMDAVARIAADVRRTGARSFASGPEAWPSTPLVLGTLFGPLGLLPRPVGPGGAAPADADWALRSTEARMKYVVGRLVSKYGYSANAAAVIVGNLQPESGLLPNRIEGSKPATPMRAPTFKAKGKGAGKEADFTAEDIMSRSWKNRTGPYFAGIGLAQWTEKGRRAGLFNHTYNKVPLGLDALSSVDGQIDYLVTELQNTKEFASANRLLSDPAVAIDAASDEFTYTVLAPKKMFYDLKHKRPRTDPRVQAEFRVRRELSRRARAAYGP